MNKIFFLLLLILSYAVQGQVLTSTSANKKFNLYISQTNGNDANNGTTPALAVQSLSRLQTLALVKVTNVRIKFLDQGVTYRGELNLSTLSGIYVDMNFCTVNLADIVTGIWIQPDAIGSPNVWQIVWSVTSGTVAEACAMTINGVQPNFVQTVTTCNSTSNSYGVTVADLADGSPITVFVNSGTNPNSDGKTYEIMKRNTVQLGDNSTLVDAMAQTAVSNNGSITMGLNAKVISSLCSFGTKHNSYLKNGLFQDIIAYEANGENLTGALGPFVANDGMDVSNYDAYFTRCMVIFSSSVAHILNSAFYSHGSGTNPFRSVTLDQCILSNDQFVGTPSVATYIGRNLYIHTTGGGMSDNPGTTLLLERSIFNPTGASVFGSVNGTTTIKNSAFYFGTTSTSANFQLASTMTAFNMLHCTFSGVSVAPMYFSGSTSSNTGTVACNYNVFAFVPNLRFHIWIDNSQTYTGDYNIFYASANQIKNSYHGTTYTTLSTWQTATGQDTHSVYITTGQLATLFLGSTSSGDFRINPNAQVTGADGTVYSGTFPDGTPLVNGGVQEHWDYNKRTIITGPPIAFPNIPISYADCLIYIKSPTSWVF